MTDGYQFSSHKPDEESEANVTNLAERAIAMMASKRQQGREPFSERLIARLIAAARDRNDAAVQGAVTDILNSGIPTDEVLAFYIPEAARRLGDGWCEDGLSFADVTIGTARLQRALRLIAVGPRAAPDAGATKNSVLLVVMEGEHHTLGAMVLAEQFRRFGISVRLLLGEGAGRVIQTVATGDFDAIFLSVGSAAKLAEARGLVEKVRSAKGRSTPVVVGGAVGHSVEDVTKATGADYSATDPHEALRLCGLKTSDLGARQRATRV